MDGFLGQGPEHQGRQRHQAGFNSKRTAKGTEQQCDAVKKNPALNQGTGTKKNRRNRRNRAEITEHSYFFVKKLVWAIFF